MSKIPFFSPRYIDRFSNVDIASQDGSYVRKFHTIAKLILENQIRTFPITFTLEYDEKRCQKNHRIIHYVYEL